MAYSYQDGGGGVVTRTGGGEGWPVVTRAEEWGYQDRGDEGWPIVTRTCSYQDRGR